MGIVIILEGPDGGGKTILGRRLSAHFQYPVLKRDKQDPFLWAISEMSAWSEKPLRIYDRFPLIGEYIYGPVWRQKIHPSFDGDEVYPVLERFYRDTLIIYCRPPRQQILINCASFPQSQPQAKDPTLHVRIIEAYDEIFTEVPHKIYDYTQDSIEDVTPVIIRHEQAWERRHS